METDFALGWMQIRCPQCCPWHAVVQRHTEGTEYTRLMRARRFVVLAVAHLLVASAAAAERVDRTIDDDTVVSRDARSPHSRIDRDAEAGKKLGLR